VDELSLLSVEEPATPVYDPTDPRVALDPWPLYAELRREAPIHRSPRGFWVLARHADCLALLRDRRASSDGNKVARELAPQGFAEARRRRGAIGEAQNDNRPFLFRDPPDHTRLRSLVAKAFTPRMVESLRPRVEATVERLLDTALERGSIDVVEDLAYPLPVEIICEMLGIPSEDHQRFSQWSAALARGLDPDFLLSDDVVSAREQALVAFAQYFFTILAERRRSPGEDLLSQLVAAEERGDSLTEGELLSTAILLLVAGHETTVNLISGGILALVQHPDQLEILRTRPPLIKPGVEEMLRWVSPVQFTGRCFLDDVEIQGHEMRTGEFVLALLASANRDPAAFESPERFDVTRTDNHHLGFGFGIHHCLGAPLARLEAEVAVSRLIARAQGIELTGDPIRYRENLVLRGVVELPVNLTAA